MNKEDLILRFQMEKHPENGYFVEKHYPSNEKRAASGSIYYYLEPDVISEFHQIDCDEYWCYVGGSSLEVWMINENGDLSIQKLGIKDNEEPMIYIPKGTIFASKHIKNEKEGTLIICITVPRFDYEGFRLILKEEMIQKYPQIESFYD